MVNRRLSLLCLLGRLQGEATVLLGPEQEQALVLDRVGIEAGVRQGGNLRTDAHQTLVQFFAQCLHALVVHLHTGVLHTHEYLQHLTVLNEHVHQVL